MKHRRYILFISILYFLWGMVWDMQAQGKRDTLNITQKETDIPTLEIHSSYQPTTLLSEKIFLRPQSLNTNTIDTLDIHYKIRPSSLIIPYKSLPINPLAYEAVAKAMPYKNYFSIFSGNTFLKTPKMRLSIGMGNGKTAHFRLYAALTEQRGNLQKIPFQQYKTGHIKAFGNITLGHIQMKMGLETEQLNYFKYGVQDVKPPDRGFFTHQDLQNYLQDYNVYFNSDASFNKVLLHLNTNLNYSLLNAHTQELNPAFSLSLENSRHKETLIYWHIKMGYNGNFLKRHPSVRPPTHHTDTLNHIAHTEGGIHYRHKTIGLDLAFNLSYSPNGKQFYYLPFIHFFHKINQDIAVLHIGWEEQLRLNNLRSLYQYNHWLNTNADNFYTTTYLRKWSLDLNGSWNNMWDYDLETFFKMRYQLPLMVNAVNELQSFRVLLAPLVRSIGIRAGINYKFRDKIRLSGYLLNENYPFNDELKFGLSPLEASLQASFFKIFNVVAINAGLLWKTGGTYLLNADGTSTKDGRVFSNSVGKIPNYLDLNFSLHIHIASFLEFYTTMANILNRPNPLWFYYNDMPLSIGGGIIVHFKTKAFNEKKRNYTQRERAAKKENIKASNIR